MKPIVLVASIIFCTLCCFTSCVKDTCTNEHTFLQRTPVYKTLEEIRQDIAVEAPKALREPGKIYFYNNYILLNEIREGLHIIDNSNPENPVKVAFISIPGNVDMAVKNNVLYADNFIDLLAIDISNPEKPVVKNRTENVFEAEGVDSERGQLVYYEEEWVTEIIDCNDWNNTVLFEGDFTGIPLSSAQSGGGVRGGTSNQTGFIGQGGSLARFTIAENFLYTVSNFNLNVFDVSDVCQPNLGATINVGWGIETIYPYKNNLFIGSQTGMFIYDISDGANPVFDSQFQHARACDPVVVKDQYAYVTLRGGTPCQGFNNQLDVIDVSNVRQPKLLKSYEMDGPHGLAITETDVLYVCDGESGLRVYDADDPLDLDQIQRKKDRPAFDVIALANEVIMVIGPEGLYQYDASDKKKLKELSLIAVEK